MSEIERYRLSLHWHSFGLQVLFWPTTHASQRRSPLLLRVWGDAVLADSTRAGTNFGHSTLISDSRRSRSREEHLWNADV